jgi:hypothetical protein
VMGVIENASRHPRHVRGGPVGVMLPPEKIRAYAMRRRVSLEQARAILELQVSERVSLVEAEQRVLR